MDPDIENLLTAENEHIIKLQEIVKKTIEDENLIIQNLLNPPKEIVTRGQNISDKVARFGGSWFFIISFLLLLTVWILFNVLVPKGDEFDPYPFILMNLVLITQSYVMDLCMADGQINLTLLKMQSIKRCLKEK